MKPHAHIHIYIYIQVCVWDACSSVTLAGDNDYTNYKAVTMLPALTTPSLLLFVVAFMLMPMMMTLTSRGNYVFHTLTTYRRWDIY